ncbi:5,10-methylene-tetrahydrofolate dehydrogenase [Pseudonocardia endophytica]|uniref:Uncharacterized protein n=1 Tax=Pseudonocardia endophytica TaxID=401976 RepID=A0A4R1HTF8_PSEEN|nr:5,10-methylene-tetrahydrofolate dehydrogenase [Pseudonocardia endophytica]TCK24661.1 hypothetical protein EV378_0444 [Pseudonocardia endophytica]
MDAADTAGDGGTAGRADEPVTVAGTREVEVCLLADPDLPATVAHRLAGHLPDLLPDRLGDTAVRWRIDVVQDPFEALVPDYERMVDKARHRVRDNDCLAICLTDAPLRDGNGVVLAEVGADDALAVVSLPALGATRVVRRAMRLVATLVEHLAPPLVCDGDRTPMRRSRSLHRLRDVAVRDPAEYDTDLSCEIIAPRATGLVRLVAGMVRANRPWRLVWGLSAAMGGALAGSAFGIFYSSIWLLADSLPPVRLAFVVVGAFVVHVTWVITGHRLWELGSASGRRDRPSTVLRNIGTTLTVTLGTLVFSTALFVLAVCAALSVITPAFLQATLGHPVGVSDYLRVALMSAVMGTVAGAVGSGLEDTAAVREATYGHRERERRAWS